MFARLAAVVIIGITLVSLSTRFTVTATQPGNNGDDELLVRYVMKPNMKPMPIWTATTCIQLQSIHSSSGILRTAEQVTASGPINGYDTPNSIYASARRMLLTQATARLRIWNNSTNIPSGTRYIISNDWQLSTPGGFKNYRFASPY